MRGSVPVAPAFLVLLLLAAGSTQAQPQIAPREDTAPSTWPTKPVRMIVPFPAGGGTDILARMVAQKLNEALGQPVIIDNRGGAGGTLGTEVAAKSAPDGYTLILVSGSHAINPGLYRTLPYDTVNDFAAISLIATSPGILVVHPALPAKSVRELIALARTRPGQLNYASAGSGTPPHLAAELFRTMASVDIVHVPYKGNAAALADVIGGHVSLTFPTMPSALPHVRSGKLRALAVTGARRSPAAPEIPTLAEAGLPGYEATSWYGLLAPARTDPGIITRLHRDVSGMLASADVKDRFAGQGLEPAANTPQQFAALIRSEIAKWSKVVKASGARAD
ncbi:MAG: tripartite tricarboxylate transporter substrate binding protein [Proteobacteria bacterium]|nr:tripartite tricarboxylate transporter substrate binding protein [Burkholderiales bacterium]